MSKQIYVGNLPGTAIINEIKALFTPYGRVAQVQFEGLERLRFAIVDMVEDSEARSALVGLQDVQMGTVTLNVNEARPRQ